MKYYVLINNSPPKGGSGESYGSKYDLNNACKNCGTQAKLVGELHTKGLNQIRESLLSTIDGDLLISNEIRLALMEEDIVLNEISNVVDHNNNPLPLYHINPKLSFPKLLPQSNGLIIEDQCAVCTQNGYFNDIVIGNLEKGIASYVKPLTFHYEFIEERFLKQSDIFHTWEHMGLSRLEKGKNKVIRYARPLLIVSEKVKKVLEGFKIKKLSFREIIMHTTQALG